MLRHPCAHASLFHSAILFSQGKGQPGVSEGHGKAGGKSRPLAAAQLKGQPIQFNRPLVADAIP